MGISVGVISAPAWRQVIVNSEFATDTAWTKGTGWTIGSHVATAASATGNLIQTVEPLVSGAVYKTRFQVVTLTAGGCQLKLGTALGTNRTAAGTYTEDITANGTAFAVQVTGAAFTGSVDNVLCVPLKETFTKSGLGTPKAAKFIISASFSNAGSQANAILGMGLADGARQFCAMGTSETGIISGSDSYRRISNTSCIGTLKATDGTLDQDADWSAWVTDGVEILWTTLNLDQAGVIPIMTVILFVGTDLNARVDTFTTFAGDEVSVTVTPGFPVDDVIVLTCGSTTAFDTTGNGLKLSVGFVDNAGGGVVNHAALNMLSTDNVSTTDVRNRISTDSAAAQPGGGPQFSLLNFTATTFDALTMGLGGACIAAYLALGFNGKAKHWVGVVDSPTVAGNRSVTAPGFKPQAVIQCPTVASAIDADVIGDSTGAGSWSIAAFDSATANSINICDSDGVTTSRTESLSDSRPVRSWRGSGTFMHTATFTSFDATGWTLDYAGVDAAVRKWPALAIEEFATGRFVSLGGYYNKQARTVLVG